MEKVRNNKRKNSINLFFIFAVIAVTLFSIFLIINYFINNNKDLYYYEYGERYGIIEDDEIGISSLEVKYPVINIDSDDVKRINNEIKNKALELKDTYLSYVGNSNYEEDEELTCTIIKIGSSKLEIEHVEYYTYEFMESDNYLTLIEWSRGDTSCSGGWNYYTNIYVINKETGKELSQEEIVALYNYREKDIIDSYKRTLINDYNEEDIDDMLSNFDFYINESSELVLIHDILSGSGNEIVDVKEIMVNH